MANVTRDTFPTNKSKNYKKVIGQEGMVGMDAEWNEFQDSLNYDTGKLIENLFNKLLNDGLHIQESASPANNFKIKTGHIFVPTMNLIAELFQDEEYTSQTDWDDSHESSSNPGALTTPSGSDRTDLVYLDLFFTEINAESTVRNSDGFYGDAYLIDPVFGQENSVRKKLAVYIRVNEGSSTLPTPPANHYYVALSYLNRLDGEANIESSMIDTIFTQRLPQDLIRHLATLNKTTINSIIGTSSSFAITFDNSIDKITIADIASTDYLWINKLLINTGNLNNTNITFTGAMSSEYYNLILKLQSSDLTLNFVKKDASVALTDDEFLICTVYWYQTDQHVRAGYYKKFLGYGDGIRKNFSFVFDNVSNYGTNKPAVYVNDSLQTETTHYTFGDGTGENSKDEIIFVSALTRGDIVTVSFSQGVVVTNAPGYVDRRNYNLITQELDSDRIIEEKHLQNEIVRPAHVHGDYVLPKGTLGLIMDEGVSTPDGFTEKKITVWDNAGTTQGKIKIDGSFITSDELRFAIRT